MSFSLLDDDQPKYLNRTHSLFYSLAFLFLFPFFIMKKIKMKNWNMFSFHISDQVQSSISKYSCFFGKRIKPTSSRCFLGNANGASVYAVINLSIYTSDIWKEWFLAFYCMMITIKNILLVVLNGRECERRCRSAP